MLHIFKMPLFFNNNLYEGFIKINGKRYFIREFLPNSNNKNIRNLIVDRRLYSILNESLNTFLEENYKLHDFPKFFEMFENFLKFSLETDSEYDMWTHNPLRAYHMYKCLEEELQEVEHFIKDINIEEGTIHIELKDSALRVHKAVLQISQNYPRKPIKIISHDLPIQIGKSFKNVLNFESVNTISNFCNKFIQCVEVFQSFWNNVLVLDSMCWILDPDKPTFKDIYRRIKISDRISVVLVFNPYMGTQRPEIKFLGCHSTVAHFRNILQKNLENDVWDPEEDLLSNLMNLLEVTFPPKAEEIEENSQNIVKMGECAICFMVRLDNEIPSEICDNSRCISYYHASCLFKYLSSVPGNKNFFGRIQGECPNCDQVISCPAPNLT